MRKTNRWTDRQTDGWTDGQTERSDFIGHCPTNAECPKIRIWINSFQTS